MLTPWVPLHHRFLTKMFVVFGFGEKQSSPTLTRVFVTVKPSTFRESKPSVFLGSVDALVDTASMYTSSKTTFFVRTKNVVQHGESLR